MNKLIISVNPSISLGCVLDKQFIQKFSNYDGTLTLVVDADTGQILNWPGKSEHYLDELG